MLLLACCGIVIAACLLLLSVFWLTATMCASVWCPVAGQSPVFTRCQYQLCNTNKWFVWCFDKPRLYLLLTDYDAYAGDYQPTALCLSVVRPFVHPCGLARYLTNYLWKFHQIYDEQDRDELFGFWGQRTRSQLTSSAKSYWLVARHQRPSFFNYLHFWIVVCLIILFSFVLLNYLHEYTFTDGSTQQGVRTTFCSLICI